MFGLRVRPELERQILETIERNNQRVHGEPWNYTSWILDAIMAKLAHQSRAEKQREKRRIERNGRSKRIADLGRLLNDSAG